MGRQLDGLSADFQRVVVRQRSVGAVSSVGINTGSRESVTQTGVGSFENCAANCFGPARHQGDG